MRELSEDDKKALRAAGFALDVSLVALSVYLYRKHPTTAVVLALLGGGSLVMRAYLAADK